MNQSITHFLSALQNIDWQSPDKFNFPSEMAKKWMLENGSLSRLLAKQCQQLSVELLHNQFIPKDELAEHERVLLSDERCLLRKVVLHGDDRAWVLGRTLIPNSSLIEQDVDLTQQGDIPLGLTVFNADNVRRDALQVGCVATEYGLLMARRSRLWMNHKPMLVAELFLPEAPFYSQENASQ